MGGTGVTVGRGVRVGTGVAVMRGVWLTIGARVAVGAPLSAMGTGRGWHALKNNKKAGKNHKICFGIDRTWFTSK